MKINLHDLRVKFPHLLFEANEILAPYTYMKVGGRATALVDVKTRADLFALCSYCFQEKIPFLVLGRGSNVIIPDEGLEKLVIRNLTSEITFKVRNETLTEVRADSGVIMAILATKTMQKELTGLEYFIGVPGTVGGAIVNNSHFTPKDLVGDNVISVEVVTTEGKQEIWGVERLKFDYDHSIFQERFDVVLSVTFLLKKGAVSMIEEHREKAALKRISTQPLGVLSSGCMYRNPIITNNQFSALSATVEVPEGAYHLLTNGKYQVAAGFLIDQAGLKGAQVGGAQVSHKHATFIVNTGQATSSDITKLCQKIETTVEDKYGISLEREVFFLK